MNRAKLGHESKAIPNGSHGKIGYVVLQTSIPPGMKTEIVQVAYENDVTIADFVRSALSHYLQKSRKGGSRSSTVAALSDEGNPR